jgi:hypothetical protein
MYGRVGVAKKKSVGMPYTPRTNGGFGFQERRNTPDLRVTCSALALNHAGTPMGRVLSLGHFIDGLWREAIRMVDAWLGLASL